MPSNYELGSAAAPDRARGSEIKTLGYISSSKQEDGSYIGGILVTDTRTRPLEFSFVSPVKPSVMQRLLHGGILDETIMVDLVAQRLLEKINQASSVLLVESEGMLALRRITAIEVVLVNDGDRTGSQEVGRGEGGSHSVGRLRAAVGEHTDLSEPFKRLNAAILEGISQIRVEASK